MFVFEHKGGEWHVTLLVSDSCHVPPVCRDVLYWRIPLTRTVCLKFLKSPETHLYMSDDFPEERFQLNLFRSFEFPERLSPRNNRETKHGVIVNL